jgi:hypothetical protein
MISYYLTLLDSTATTVVVNAGVYRIPEVATELLSQG